ncbi:hypothetical protein ACP70R_002964 [Stipagrostis hirtigluma subsp. patula]
MNYATVSSFAALEAVERALPSGAVVAVTVAAALPDGDAPAVRDLVRKLGWVLTNPSRLELKVSRANAAFYGGGGSSGSEPDTP